MNDGKIYIYITNKEPQATETTKEITETTTTKTIKEKDGNIWLEHELAHFLRQQAAQMVQYSISNIGNFTGDYQTQREVQHAVQLGGKLLGIGTATLAGFKIAGAGGALVAGSIAVASSVINFTLQEAQAQLSINKQNYEIEKLREISGLNGLTNGSRI